MFLAFVVFTWAFLVEPILSNVEIYRNEDTGVSFGNFETHPGKRISDATQVLSVIRDSSQGKCVLECLSNTKCISTNFKTETDSAVCELLETDRYSSQQHFSSQNEWMHFSIKTKCGTSPCKHGKCTPEYNSGGYSCTCNPGYRGINCEKEQFKSCQDVLSENPGTPSGAQTLFDAETQTTYEIYCFMESITGCGSGPWTTALKIKGSLTTFRYNSNHWKNKIAYNEAGGKTGLDDLETKMRTYWTTATPSLCVGMKSGSAVNWLKITFSSLATLYDKIADGNYRSTSVAKNTWKNLLAGTSLQAHCNRQGFNSLARIRLGLKANNENNCGTCDTWIGFGEWSRSCGQRHNTNVNCYILIK